MDSSTFPLLRDGRPCVVLALPRDSSGDEAARLISRAMRERFGFEPPVLSGTAAPAGGSILALGCLANNPLIESLYLRFRTLVDRWYPGAGGYAIQPVALAGPAEPRILLIGASDAAGLMDGARAFSTILRSTDPARPALPWKLTVKLGSGHLPLPEDRIDVLGTSSSEVPAPHSEIPDTPYSPAFRDGSARDHLLRLGMYGPHADNFHFSRSSELGLRFLYSGDLEDARRYRACLHEEIVSGVLRRLYHYKSIRMFQLWELLQGSEVFSEEDRRLIDKAILDYLIHGGVASEELIREKTTERGIFDRHTACEALNLWLGADYFNRATGDESWLEHRSIAEAYFRSHAGTDVPFTGLTEGYCTYLEICLEWMVLTCPESIGGDASIRLWADRLAGLCTNRGTLLEGAQTDSYRYCYQLMRRLAHFLNDGRYLFVSDLRERAVRAGNDRVAQFSAGQAWATDLEPVEPADGARFTVYPLNERHRLWLVPELEAASGFDRAVGRAGWRIEDDYLAIIGIIGPNKTLPNAGAVAAYDRYGARLLASPEMPLYADENSPAGYSVVTVNVEGSDAACRRAVELVHRSSTQGLEIVAWRASVSGLYTWYRVICWRPGGFLLAADSVSLSRRAGATAAVHWRCAGPVSSIEHGAVSSLEAAGGEPINFRIDACVDSARALRLWVEDRPQNLIDTETDHTTRRLPVVHLETELGARPLPIVSLLQAGRGDRALPYTLDVEGDSATLRGQDRTYTISGLAPDQDEGLIPSVRSVPAGAVAPAPARARARAGASSFRPGARSLETSLRSPVLPSAWSASASSAFLAMGTRSGDCLLLDRAGKLACRARARGAVTAVLPLEGGIIAGTAHGEVVRFDPEGRELWSHHVPRRPERAFWWWWFTSRPMVGALAWGRDGPSGRSLVVAGTGSCSLNVLDAESGALRADELSRYGLADLVRAEHDAQGRLELMVGHTRFTCSSTVRAWRAPWTEESALRYDRTRAGELRPAGWDMSGVRDFAVDGDSVAVLRHGTFNQLSSYAREDGGHRWTVDVGGTPAALVPGRDGAGSFGAASRDGWLSFYDSDGRKVSSSRVMESLTGMATLADGRLAAWGARQALVEEVRGGPLLPRALEEAGKPLGWIRTAALEGLLWLDDDGIAVLAL